nr:splicing factor, proline- and glutamine-rich-like isoform X1 [Aedes albopictus]XP_029734868.1 splicing factor, proline- and glutamine-rich-like isoform X1 [Aedes albopictus]XP_029734869.1 splicing factor, proline- and glutamine-rich-like isoform X1 [Aedes albopictus]XP_029734870.1 splicing factor, proline- and glutamine-rich-like isoform X1 [Aedes albopictus]XP_029734872.1 splicing factor, proline- and glutamine-rich-like isoform X1 [Aedes albopictus]
MELSRIKIFFGGLVLQLLFTIAVPLPYNKYGRQCSDIGCLSSQVCVMAYDSCSLNQREGNECGRYPTCKKKTDAGLAAGPSDSAQDLYSNNPTPPKASAPSSSGGDDDVLTSLGLNPDRPASRPNQNPYSNPYPALPVNPPQPAAPYHPPAPAPASPSGGNNYYGGGGGGGSSGGNRRPGQFDGSGGNIVVPTQKPAAPSGGFFSGIFGGIQNAVSNAVKQQVGTYINQRLGIGPATGGAGGLFDANRFIDTKNFGSLFSEKKSSGSSSAQPTGSSNSAVGPYPVTVDQRTSVYSANAQPNSGSSYEQYRRQGSSESQYRRQGAASTPAPYGWKLD